MGKVISLDVRVRVYDVCSPHTETIGHTTPFADFKIQNSKQVKLEKS